jgi:hypothetical protein
MDHPNEMVLEQIQNKITPVNETAPMPWAPAPTPPPEV